MRILNTTTRLLFGHVILHNEENTRKVSCMVFVFRIPAFTINYHHRGKQFCIGGMISHGQLLGHIGGGAPKFPTFELEKTVLALF
jgi:hypothetical protein